MTDPTPGATRRNHLLWLGPLIAIPGFISYWGFFVRWPSLRDTAWLNILILLVALAISVVGLRRAWSGGLLKRAAGLGSATVPALLLAGLVAYCYGLSYGLPDAARAAGVGERMPAVTLTAHDGTTFDLGAASDEPLVLVFYRGFW